MKRSSRGNQILANAIKQKREDYGILQKDIAKAIHMSTRNYQKIEEGQRKITVELDAKIMRALVNIHAKNTNYTFNESQELESVANEMFSLFMDLFKGSNK